MLRSVIAGLAALTCAAPLLAQNMPLSVFMPKAEALQKKGMMAAFSADTKLIVAEAKAGFKAYRTELKAEAAAGHPSSCPPEKAAIASNDLLKSFATVPLEQRAGMSVKQAAARYMMQRYPCKH